MLLKLSQENRLGQVHTRYCFSSGINFCLIRESRLSVCLPSTRSVFRSALKIMRFDELLFNSIFLAVVTVLLVVPCWRLSRRAGFSGWFCLTIFIPYAGWIFFLWVIAFSESLDASDRPQTRKEWLAKGKLKGHKKKF